MSTGLGPYLGTDASDTGAGSPVFETPLIASQMTVHIGGTMMDAEVFGGTIPGPTFRSTSATRWLFG